MKLSLFKLGIIFSIIGMVLTSIVFLEGDKTTSELVLELSSSHKIVLNFEGEGIGYYKIFMPEYSGEKVFVQVLDNNQNVISEQNVHTKMSVKYFDFENSEYAVNVTNISKNPINMIVEFGNTNSHNMIPSGIMVLVGTVLIVISSYVKLNNYKIEHPDENIS